MTRDASLVKRIFSYSNQRESKTAYFLVASLIIGLAAALPLFSGMGLLNTRGGGDSPFLLQRLQQLYAALSNGHFPVRWMPDANYGYGYPFFNYYAPLSIYVSALFHYLGLSYVQAIKFTQLAGFLLASGGMFYLARRWIGGNWAGLLAAAAYTIAPFHLVNVYVRGDSLAEFWAMAVYPLVFLAIDALLERLFIVWNSSSATSINIRSRWYKFSVAMFALAYAGLILSHNISALILSAFILVYILLAAWWFIAGFRNTVFKTGMESSIARTRGLKSLAFILVAIILGLCLSGWFWLPALAESSLVQLAPVTEGYFNFSNHFKGLELVQPFFFFNYDITGDPFRMGLVQTIAIFAGLSVLLFGSRTREHNRDQVVENSAMSETDPVGPWTRPRVFIITGLLISTFMITPWSRVLWDNLPLLPLTQFPWRFLSVQSFFGALVVSGLALLPGRRIVVPSIILILLISGLGRLQVDFLPVTDADITPEKLAEYEWFTGNIGSTVSAEYLPLTVQPRPYTSAWLNAGERNNVWHVNGSIADVQNEKRQTSRQSWLVDVPGTSATIAFPTIDWPNWRSSIPGAEIDVFSAPGSGSITNRLPEGQYELELRLTRTPIRVVGELLALVATALMIWLLWPEKAWHPSRIVLVIATVFLLAFITLRLIPEGRLDEDDLSWDFAQMAYLHHAPDGIPFENGAVLSSYRYSQDEVVAGNEWELTLVWQGGEELPATIALFTPAIHRFRRAPSLVKETLLIAGEESEFRFTIPENAPAGLYVPRLTFPNAQALTPSGQRRGDLFLKPLRIVDLPLTTGTEVPPLDVRAVDVQARNRETLDIQLQWLTQEPLTKDYNYSLRIANDDGAELTQFDGQPGYGFQPTSLWQTGVWVDDWLAMAIPERLPKQSDQSASLNLMVRLYDVETGEVVLVRNVGELTMSGAEVSFQPTQRMFEVPADIEAIEASFGFDENNPIIELRGYSTELGTSDLEVELYWQSLQSGFEDLFHFVHLVDLSSGDIVAQHDSRPMNGTYPTGQWIEGEVVADRIKLDVSQLVAGEYELIVGLYRQIDGDLTRLRVLDQMPEDSLTLPDSITIKGR